MCGPLCTSPETMTVHARQTLCCSLFACLMWNQLSVTGQCGAGVTLLMNAGHVLYVSGECEVSVSTEGAAVAAAHLQV